MPKTETAKNLLVKKLRHRKKELQADKRKETTTMAGIRREARVQSVSAGKTWLGSYDSLLAADQRRAIRNAKESALGPHEEAAAAIERQIMNIESILLWLDPFD
ncbi:MAG: hypothetical protein ACLQM8_17380 [Limisphaerales bacterium]